MKFVISPQKQGALFVHVVELVQPCFLSSKEERNRESELAGKTPLAVPYRKDKRDVRYIN